MKKALLAVIPALLVLSACQAGPKANDNKTFLEDTLAHEELFGQATLVQPNVRKVGSDPIEHPDVSDPSIGVQSKVEDGKVSFRFVAAVTFTENNITPTVAKWYRTVSAPDGSVYSTYDGEYACTTAYKKLSNGGSAYDIQDFNEAHGNSTYTHFVVYTIRNIPVSTYGNYYVAAYLNLSGEGGVNQTTKVVATTVNEANQWAFDGEQGEFFITGNIGGSQKLIEASAKRVHNNHAEFEYIDFAAGDTFVINEFYKTDFMVHNAVEVLQYTGNTKITSCFENDGFGNIKVKASMGGSYGLYLNGSNQLYTEENAPFGVHNGFYIKGTMNEWAQSDAWELYNDRNNRAVSKEVDLTSGQKFKIWQNSGGNGTWFGWPDGSNVSNDTTLFSCVDGNDKNIQCNKTGKYIIYLNNDSKVWINPVVAE